MRKTKFFLLAGTVLPAFALSAPTLAEVARPDAPIVLAQQDAEPGSRREQRQQERQEQRGQREERGGGNAGAERGGGADRAQQREERQQQRPERAGGGNAGGAAGAASERAGGADRAQQRDERQQQRPERAGGGNAGGAAGAEPERAGGADRAQQREERQQQRPERAGGGNAGGAAGAEPERAGGADRAQQRDERQQQRPERAGGGNAGGAAGAEPERAGGADRAQQREERQPQRQERDGGANTGDGADRAQQRDERGGGNAGGGDGSLRDRMNKDRPGDRQDAQDKRLDAKEKREDALEKREDRREKLEDRQEKREDGREKVEDRKERREDLQERREDKRDAKDERIDRLKDQRRERRDGDRVIITEPGGRSIIREGNRTIIRRDETARFRLNARDVREERRGGEIRTIVTRPDGSRIITVTDDNGRLLRRIRESGGREYVLIDNRPRGGRDGLFINLDIAPPRISIPRERYIVEGRNASSDDMYEAFEAEPVARPERGYSLDEIRQSQPLRSYVRSVDVDSITFDTGSWEVRDDQISKLEKVGKAMERSVKKDPQTVFMVEGHTDAVGADDDNLSLSDRRAESVAEILTKYFDIPAENLTTQGYGEQYLKVETEGAEERNRRVSVRNITPLLSSKN